MQEFQPLRNDRTKVSSTSSPGLPRILIFTHISEQRDGQALLETLASCIKSNNIRPEYVIFTTYQERRDGSKRIGKHHGNVLAPFPTLTHIATRQRREDPRNLNSRLTSFVLQSLEES